MFLKKEFFIVYQYKKVKLAKLRWQELGDWGIEGLKGKGGGKLSVWKWTY